MKQQKSKKNIEDMQLPALPLAVDPTMMRGKFQELFAQMYPERGLKISACRIGRVYHKPGKKCTLSYRISGHDGENRNFAQLFTATISVGEKAKGNGQAAYPASWPGCGQWKPAAYWPEMKMTLHAFPYDPHLPYLGQLLEEEFVKRRVEDNLAVFGLGPGWKCCKVAIRNRKYMPAKRCVLRYEIVLEHKQAGRREVAFYGKTYQNAQSRYVYDVLQEIGKPSASAAGVFEIPGVITHIDEANTFWQHAWEGENLSKLAGRIGWNRIFASGYILKIAEMLAGLQQIEISSPRLQGGKGMAATLRNAQEDAAKIRKFLPESGENMARITAALSGAASRLNRGIPQTTIHGTFKIAQILCRGDCLALIDFDSVSHGDPLYDVGEFVASLAFLQVSDHVSAEPLAEAINSFLSAYRKQAPWPFDESRLAWYVVAFLLGKMHSALKRLETGGPEIAGQAFDLVQGWLEKGKLLGE